MPLLEQPPPLALYIHFPWCVKKCPYCDFNSHETTGGESTEADYLDALLRDLEFELPRIGERSIISIFIGGGTPSLISARGMDRLLTLLRSRLHLNGEAEITLEANPGTAEAARFRDYRLAGINRLSIGVQSFDDGKLKSLGRIHNAAEARQAIDMARQVGFDNINIDLMYGLPGQSVTDAQQDLQTAVACAASHISRYQLTLEPNTRFYKYPPVLPDEDDCWTMQTRGDALLSHAGFLQYEISAYALNGHRCLHNLNYWEFDDYLGIGAGAHGKITDAETGVVKRYARHRLPAQYVQGAGSGAVIVQQRTLTDRDLILEFMMNTMRLTDGVPVPLFRARTGLSMRGAEQQLQQAEQRGLLDRDFRGLRSTQLGRRYLNDLLQFFMDDHGAGNITDSAGADGP
jgi:oxygen-independent coproporphyrinogen-3 oxidase